MENKTVNLDTLVKNRGLEESAKGDVSVLEAEQEAGGENQEVEEQENQQGEEQEQENNQGQESEEEQENQEQNGEEEETDPYSDIPRDRPENYEQQEDVELDLSDLTINQDGAEIPISAIIEERNDLLARVQEIEKDPFLKEFVTFYKNGGDIGKYLENKTVKYDTMADIDVLKHVFNKENSDLNPTVRERLFKKEMANKYGFDPDNISEEDAASDDFKLAQELIKRDAFRTRESLKSEQKKFSIPERKQEVDPQVEREATRKQVMSNKEVMDFLRHKLVRIDVPDDNGNYFAFIEKNPEEVVEMIVDGNKFWEKLIDKDTKKVDWNKAHKVLSYAIDPVAYEKELIKLGRRQGQRDKIMHDRNIDGRLNQRFEADTQEKPFLQGLAEAFRAKAKQKK